ncbi:hypothetical protein BCR34DRAFT_154371 [Clohesyomyces aquaticus]|uniref:Rad50/SbcC-type AAA domain-containing protein n=1 Tax=Clohesyomyces aquaticus TaxID=1231657 RepID=A0A1Y2A0A5_9PLEO|nr:hypothetical protein BCR34DRAFT_154371 [Clohesyomyces aquaticus]
MAPVLPSKRRRAQTNDLDFMDGDAGPSQQGRSKRAKPHAPQGFDSQSSSDEEASASSQGGALAVRNRNDADDDAEAFRQQTQVVAKNFRDAKGRKNAAAEQGIVEEIRCTNFMCHEQLHVKLGPLINFIIGHNGSGKSAVLTALTLCLGGKATATNRGQNLKSFIKEGRDYCVLSVRIKNQGTAAYKPELLHKEIGARRHHRRLCIADR